MTEDLILRERAIEAFGEEPEVWSGKDEYEMGLNNQWHYDRNAIMAVPAAEPHWIPVTERLPEPNEIEHYVRKYYLIQNEYGDMMVAAYHGNESGETWWEQMYAYKPVEDETVAWMPLPIPWEGENDAAD